MKTLSHNIQKNIVVILLLSIGTILTSCKKEKSISPVKVKETIVEGYVYHNYGGHPIEGARVYLYKVAGAGDGPGCPWVIKEVEADAKGYYRISHTGKEKYLQVGAESYGRSDIKKADLKVGTTNTVNLKGLNRTKIKLRVKNKISFDENDKFSLSYPFDITITGKNIDTTIYRYADDLSGYEYMDFTVTRNGITSNHKEFIYVYSQTLNVYTLQY